MAKNSWDTPEYRAHEARELDKLESQITWPLGSQGVCEGQDTGRVFEYLEGKIGWNQLTPAEKQVWQWIQPR